MCCLQKLSRNSNRYIYIKKIQKFSFLIIFYKAYIHCLADHGSAFNKYCKYSFTIKLYKILYPPYKTPKTDHISQNHLFFRAQYCMDMGTHPQLSLSEGVEAIYQWKGCVSLVCEMERCMKNLGLCLPLMIPKTPIF